MARGQRCGGCGIFTDARRSSPGPIVCTGCTNRSNDNHAWLEELDEQEWDGARAIALATVKAMDAAPGCLVAPEFVAEIVEAAVRAYRETRTAIRSSGAPPSRGHVLADTIARIDAEVRETDESVAVAIESTIERLRG